MKYGALILSLGGTLAAGIQALGYLRAPGFIMLACNLAVILIAWQSAREKKRYRLASERSLVAFHAIMKGRSSERHASPPPPPLYACMKHCWPHEAGPCAWCTKPAARS